jgi:hypothetical protein
MVSIKAQYQISEDNRWGIITVAILNKIVHFRAVSRDLLHAGHDEGGMPVKS